MKYLTLSLLLLPMSLFAQDFTFNKETGKAVPSFVGELKLLKGRVLRTTGGRPRVVEIGEKFYPKDVIATEANSSMKILVTDDTWLAIGPESEVVFTDFSYKDKNSRTINYELKKGQLSANVRQKIKDGGLNFRTRFATMGIRGTKFLMNYREINGQAISEYAVLEGETEVTNSRGEIQKVSAREKIVLIDNLKTKEGVIEKLPLTPEDLESFVSSESDEEKGIRPFMPYYEPKALTVTSSDKTGRTTEKISEETSSGSGSFDNLKKLNEQLDANQKNKR